MVGDQGANGSAGEGMSVDVKLVRLQELLRSWGSVALGFSGGVDSTFLAAVCERTIPDTTLLVHLETPFAATPEVDAARELLGASAGELAQLSTVAIPFNPLAWEDVVRNDAKRCYYCKRAGFELIAAEARARGIAVVADGSNADDASDDRPGMWALRELGVRSPLMETGWRKDEERALLRAWGFARWDMPAGACLATRVRCGELITAAKLDVVRACEDYLHELGFRQVRARLGSAGVRVEFGDEDFERTDGVLPPDARAELERRAGCPVDERAVPYRRGVRL